MKNKSFWLGNGLAILAGCLITFSLAPFNFWPLAFLAPLALWWLLQDLSSKQALVRGWFFGVGVFGSGASWVFVSIYQFSATPLVGALALTLVFIVFLAGFFALQAWVWRVFLKDTNALVSWPALWVLSEAFRSWAFTGFPWLLLGSAHLTSPLSGWLPVVGVYGVSGLSAALGLLVYCCCVAQQRKALKLAYVGVVGALLLGGQILQAQEWTSPKGEVLEVGLVQGNIAQEDKWNPSKTREIIQTYLQASHALGAVDVLIWPETALPLLPQEAVPYLEWALEQAKPNASLITGLIDIQQGGKEPKYFNGIFTAGATSEHYYKTKLVPFGEYLPLENQLRGLIDFFNLPMSNFSAGTQVPQSLTVADTQVGPLICYEVAYPSLSIAQARVSDWLVTISNDAWFGASIGPLQHLQLAQVRALETGRPVVRVTNNGISGVIDHKGALTLRLPQFEQASATAKLQPRQGVTPFMQTGILPLLVLCLFLLEMQRYFARVKLARAKLKAARMKKPVQD